jgi:hypothetical protein
VAFFYINPLKFLANRPIPIKMVVDFLISAVSSQWVRDLTLERARGVNTHSTAEPNEAKAIFTKEAYKLDLSQPLGYIAATHGGVATAEAQTGNAKAADLELTSQSQDAVQGVQATVEEKALGAKDDSEVEAKDPTKLSEEEQKQVDDLKLRDQEVRTHEQAHLAAAGGYARGGIQLEMQAGPDGKNYAVGGHVQLDVSPVPGDDSATIQKAQVIKSAALAPAQPSSQDRVVAAQAQQMETEARVRLQAETRVGNTTRITGYSASGSARSAQQSSQLNILA